MQSNCDNSSYTKCENPENGVKVEIEILRLTAIRGPDKSICPSEVARTLFPKCWRNHMPFVRQVGFKLTREDKIQVCQKGTTVNNPNENTIKGPIRFRISCTREREQK